MFTRWILLFMLEISLWLLVARASFVETAKNNFVEEYTKSCPSDGIPVCGTRGSDYFLLPNKCWLNEVNGEDLVGLFGTVKQAPIKYCINGCNLMCPEVHEPVCALNVHTNERKLFKNLCLVTEYSCRTDMEFQQIHPAECEQSTQGQPTTNFAHLKEVLENPLKTLGKRSKISKKIPIPCTGVFKPVCGVYKGVKSTFKNECLLNAENVKFGKDWRIVNYGICREDFSNVKRNAHKRPIKGHSVRKRSYGTNTNFISYQRTEPLKPEIDLSSNDLFRHMAYIPQIFQSQYMPRVISNSALKDQITNSIIQKIISMPAPILDATPQEQVLERNLLRNQEILPPSNVKPMDYRERNMYFNYDHVDNRENEIFPTVSPVLERNEILSPIPAASQQKVHFASASQPLKRRSDIFSSSSKTLDLIRTHRENSVSNKNKYFSHAHPVNSPITAEPIRLFDTMNDAEATTYTPPSTIPTEETKATVRNKSKTAAKVDHFFIISRKTTPKLSTTRNIAEKIVKANNGCKYGNKPICGVLSNGSLKTFKNICELMTTNSFLRNPWVKLHYGICEKCDSKCSTEFKPICVQRNGLNYTMANECYYNMGICMDKRSKWKRISDGECVAKEKFNFKYNVTPVQQMKTSMTTPIIDTSTTVSIKATPIVPPRRSAFIKSKRLLRKRNRKSPGRSHPPTLNTKNTENLESVIMNLTKRRN